MIVQYLSNKNESFRVAGNNVLKYREIISQNVKVLRKYDYQLDPFQEHAIRCINTGNCDILVAANTSAGKTVVAQQAIDDALDKQKRTIYTSPIKALSNQKFNEFSKKCVPGKENCQISVGLITGDNSINEESSCLVMTTEILLQKVFENDDFFDDVEWIIFDEIHYIADKDRGSVWEQCIMLLPKQIKLIFLSASIPNADEFAEWIFTLKERPCHIIETFKRPVPLRTFIYVKGKNIVTEVIDLNGEISKSEISAALNTGSIDTSISNAENVYKVVKALEEQKRLPCCVFSFSRKTCDRYAESFIKAQVKFNNEEERQLVTDAFNKAFRSFNGYPPQISNSLSLLASGIAVHHSGIHPRLKELVEILTSFGLIKVLFATETFSVGLNIPLRSVVFSQLMKFDGEEERMITCSEFLQLSGRAGRRDKDKCGVVVVMCSPDVDVKRLIMLIGAKPERLESKFMCSIWNILNLINKEGVSLDRVLKCTFQWFQHGSLRNERDRLQDLCERASGMFDLDAEKSLYELNQSFINQQEQVHQLLKKPRYCSKYITQTRIVEICRDGQRFGFGLILKVVSRTSTLFDPDYPKLFDITVLMKSLLDCNPLSKRLEHLSPVEPGDHWYPTIVEIGIENVYNYYLSYITSLPILANVNKTTQKELISRAARGDLECVDKLIGKESFRAVFPFDDIENLEAQFNMNELLALVKDSTEDAEKIDKLILSRNELKQFLNNHRTLEYPQVQYDILLSNQKRLREIAKLLNAPATDLINSIQMLKTLKYINEDERLMDKGRVCQKICHPASLIITELLFDDVIRGKKSSDIAALFSCFVCNESCKPPDYEKYKELYGHLKTIHERVYGNTMVKMIQPHMMHFIASLINGTQFESLVFEDIFPGSIVYCIRQLFVLLENVSQAIVAKELKEPVMETRKAVAILFNNFASSLYGV